MDERKRFEIQHVEAPLKKVMDSYAAGLKPKGEKQSIFGWEAFVDTAKDRVIFRVTVENHD